MLFSAVGLILFFGLLELSCSVDLKMFMHLLMSFYSQENKTFSRLDADICTHKQKSEWRCFWGRRKDKNSFSISVFLYVLFFSFSSTILCCISSLCLCISHWFVSFWQTSQPSLLLKLSKSPKLYKYVLLLLSLRVRFFLSIRVPLFSPFVCLYLNSSLISLSHSWANLHKLNKINKRSQSAKMFLVRCTLHV